MRIRSYKARTAAEALEMVRQDMGPSALIIQTRPIRGRGLSGVFGGEGVEVVAGTDDAPAGGAGEADIPTGRTFRHLHDTLIASGVLPALARSLVEEALCRYPSPAFAQKFPAFADRIAATPAGDDLLEAVGGAVAKTLRIERGQRPKDGPKVVALVGPTGVGKTTTIAKLATIAALRHQLPTGLITIDTYRIGAVDQLKTYSEMLGAPMAVVRSESEMPAALERFSDRAVVFVDTIGRSPRDRERVNELAPFLSHAPNAETHLVVSASAKYEDALLTANNFGKLRPARLIFSKVDESTRFGSIYNLAVQTQLPLSYLTIGQEVPDDIEVTTPMRIAQLLLGDEAEAGVEGRIGA